MKARSCGQSVHIRASSEDEARYVSGSALVVDRARAVLKFSTKIKHVKRSDSIISICRGGLNRKSRKSFMSRRSKGGSKRETVDEMDEMEAGEGAEPPQSQGCASLLSAPPRHARCGHRLPSPTPEYEPAPHPTGTSLARVRFPVCRHQYVMIEAPAPADDVSDDSVRNIDPAERAPHVAAIMAPAPSSATL